MKRFISIFTFLMLIPQIAQASSFLRVCTATGNCGICDIVAQAILLGKWLIAGAGGLALLVIIIAAFGMVASAGNPEKINSAKKQIIGALLGVFIVMIAFQLVVMIIGIFATPDKYASFDATQTTSEANTQAGKQGSLSRFLGVAWWTICSEQDLRAKNGASVIGTSSTATCKYWGDGTACAKLEDVDKGAFVKMCFDGNCVEEGGVPKRINKINENEIKNPCDFLAATDKTYQQGKISDQEYTDYACRPRSSCFEAISIEQGLCPTQDSNQKDPTVCCATTN